MKELVTMQLQAEKKCWVIKMQSGEGTVQEMELSALPGLE